MQAGAIAWFREEIVRGYWAPDGRVVGVTDEDLANLPLPSARSLEVHGFLPLDQVSPTRLGKPYYLRPDEPIGLKPYTLLRQALERSGKGAVIKQALRGREILALVHPHRSVLVLRQLHWPDEVQPASDLAPPETVTVTNAELDAADALIDAIGPVDLANERDHYAEAVEQVVEAKLAGAPPPEAAPVPQAPTVDLMAALRASLEQAGRSPKTTDAPRTPE